MISTRYWVIENSLDSSIGILKRQSRIIPIFQHLKFLVHLVVVVCSVLVLIACEAEPVNFPDIRLQIAPRPYLQNYPLELSATLLGNNATGAFDYAWEFGDNSTAFGQVTTHSYQTPGSYQIRLTLSSGSASTYSEAEIEIKPSLELVQSFELAVESPSGLCFGLDRHSLWTVSDKPNGLIKQLDFRGNTLRTLSYYGDDLEGITFDVRDSTLWVVDESLASLIHLDTNGVVLRAQWISGVSDGSGLEGIALDPVRNRIFLVKEKDYSALLILNDSLDTQNYQRIHFADDYAGLYYSIAHDQLWMLSDEESSIYLADTLGQVQATFGFQMVQPEGFVFDEVDSIFYIIDDTAEQMRTYRFWD